VGASNATLPSDNIVLVFSENIAAVSGGTITLVNDATNTSITITTTDTTQVTITDNVMTINPTEDLMQTNNYHIEINEGAVTDLIGNDFVAIIDSSFSFTVDDINDAPTGGATITGPAKAGQTLTVTNDIIDIDGITSALNYQWSRTDSSGTETEVTGATDSTYLLTDDDIGFTFENTVSYTDDGGFGNTVVTSATAEVTDIVKLVQIRNIHTLTAAEASQEINDGYDRTNSSTEQIISFDLYLDAEGIELLNANASEILGAQMNLSFDSSLFENVGSFASSSNTSYMMDVVSDLSPTVNNATGDIALASSSAIVDTDTSNDSDWPPIGVERIVATVYLNPVDDATNVALELQSMIIDANGLTLNPLEYSVDLL
jgi:hypothetical protein